MGELLLCHLSCTHNFVESLGDTGKAASFIMSYIGVYIAHNYLLQLLSITRSILT